MKRIFGKRSGWFNQTARIALFVGIIAFGAFAFISKEMYWGLLPVGMGAVAFAKYLYDIRVPGNQDSE